MIKTKKTNITGAYISLNTLKISFNTGKTKRYIHFNLDKLIEQLSDSAIDTIIDKLILRTNKTEKENLDKLAKSNIQNINTADYEDKEGLRTCQGVVINNYEDNEIFKAVNKFKQ